VTPILRLAMTATSYPPGTVYMPHTWARLVRGTAFSRRLRALVDTGARQTIASFAAAKELGLGAEDLAQLPTTKVAGLGGREQPCHEARMDLHIGPSLHERLTLRDARVFFVPALVGDYDLLVGQCDALERLILVQRNQAPKREFVLRFPD
jgi:hypothetical protein